MVSDQERYNDYSDALVEAAREGIENWVQRSVRLRYGPDLPPDVAAQTTEAAHQAGIAVAEAMAELVHSDIDQQRSTPLSVCRLAVGYASAVLAEAGVAPVVRDRDAQRLHPDDVYDLAIGGFSDISDDFQAAGITWGAAKAHLHIQRRRDLEEPNA